MDWSDLAQNRQLVGSLQHGDEPRLPYTQFLD